MKVSDYIVEYLIKKEITDVFGYPGGMVTHLMESFRKYDEKISAHVTYHEQGAAFAACGYAQISGKVGVAYATSGPGATNLITGICNSYFDSIPCLFITGQVNTFESKGDMQVRQRGFQETEIVSMVKGVTKYAAYVETAEQIKFYLDRAFIEATTGRPGAVLLDIPMNIFQSEIEIDQLKGYEIEMDAMKKEDIVKQLLKKELNCVKRPCILIGNGIKISGRQDKLYQVVEKLQLPVVTSMIAFDIIQDSEWNYGFIGAYGNREANFIVAKSDLVISIGSRLDVRQVGFKRENFAPNARIIRMDIDKGECANKIHEDEICICCCADEAIKALEGVELINDFFEWKNVCIKIRKELHGIDEKRPNKIITELSECIPKNTVITTDVGQNQVWVAQSFKLKSGQKVLFSGGHGAMGYSLPAAIGTFYGCGKNPVICLSGDGGFQMNIQELQFIARENIPIKIVILNNNALGMIRHFQEMYFNSEYFQTKPESGYSVPSFARVAEAYGIRGIQITDISQIENKKIWTDDEPILIEIVINEDTYVFPKLEFGKPNQDQEPLLSRGKYQELMNL